MPKDGWEGKFGNLKIISRKNMKKWGDEEENIMLYIKYTGNMRGSNKKRGGGRELNVRKED